MGNREWGMGNRGFEGDDRNKECGLCNLEFHDKYTEAPQERLCVLCAFVA